MAVGDTHVFPSLLIPVLTQRFFPKPPTTFLTCFRGETPKNAGKKFCLNWVSNSQLPGHESDLLTTEPPGLGPFFERLGQSHKPYPAKNGGLIYLRKVSTHV